MTATPTLTAPGIVLRPLVLAVAPALFVALSDPQDQLYRRAPAHTALAETEAYIADTLAKSPADGPSQQTAAKLWAGSHYESQNTTAANSATSFVRQRKGAA